MDLLGWEKDILVSDSHYNDVWLFYSEQELQRVIFLAIEEIQWGYISTARTYFLFVCVLSDTIF